MESLVVDKSKIPLDIRDPYKFFTMALYCIIHNATLYSDERTTQIIIVTDRIPLNKKRNAIEKAIKRAIKPIIPENIKYQILHHESRSHYGLQIADYCNWAVYRKFEKGDEGYYAKINLSNIINRHKNVDGYMNGIFDFWGDDIFKEM